MVKIVPIGTMSESVCECNLNCLHNAAKAADRDGIAILLRNGENIWKKDKGGRTPLHWAVSTTDTEMALDCVKLLLEVLVQYSDKSKFINSQDGSYQKTALDWAAAKCHTSVMEYLIQNGADVRLLDKESKSVLHTLAQNIKYDQALCCARMIIDSVALLDEKARRELINQKTTESNRRTAAHVSAVAGNDKLLEYLIQNGADVLETDSSEYNVLHLSALNAFDETALKCTRVLLTLQEIDMPTKTVLLNAKEQYGRGPIHIAARRGNHLVLEVLIRHRANILIQEDKSGSTALHLAASLGNEAKADLCVEELLKNLSDEEKHFFVNVRNVNDFTALYLSAKHHNVEACKKLLLAGSKFDLSTKRNKTPLEKVYKKIPEAMVVLLDEAIKNSGYTSRFGAIDIFAELDFGPILGYDTTNDNLYKETEELAKIRYAKFESREVILDHPFVRIFIWKKWQEIWWIFAISRVIHIFWFAFNFFLLVLFYRVNCPFKSTTQFSWNSLRPSEEETNITEVSLVACKRTDFLPWGAGMNLIALLIFLLGLVHPTKQRYQWYYKPMKISPSPTKTKAMEKYWKTFKHYARIWFKVTPLLELAFGCLVLVTTLPIFNVLIFSDPVHYALAGVMGFVTWFFVYLEIGRIPQCGVYIHLLKEASKTLGFAILVHLPILFGFAAVFILLMQRMPSFSSLSQAVVKILTLMIGELDYQGLFYSDDKDALLFDGIEMIALGVFVVFVAVVVLNFLIGLATDGITGFRGRAKVWKLCAQIEQIVLLESFLDNGLPLGKYFLKRIMLMPPRNIDFTEELQQIRRCEIYIPELPKDLQKEIHNLNLPTL